MNTLLLVDSYKLEHHKMYNQDTTLIYSNLTPRKSRIPGINSVVVFGVQHFALKYLVEHFNTNFFNRHIDEIVDEYKFATQVADVSHVKALHKLGYLPIELKALEEGTLCPIGVPLLTIRNTHPNFFWVTNYLETLLSCCLWQPITSATIALEYKKILTKFALETTGDAGFVQYQGHDFSMRGMSSPESAITSGMGHLTSFVGTDVVPAHYELRDYYGASTPAGGSVPATEHSVMCLGGKESEIETFKRLLNLYPTGILSVVSDTWDLWKVITEYLPILKDEILARDGKLVIRPDSGDPVDIICGLPDLGDSKADSSLTVWVVQNAGNPNRFLYKGKAYKYDEDAYLEFRQEFGEHADYEDKEFIEELELAQSEQKGVIELLWNIFGGKINDYGYKELDPHIGAIYGDSITLDRAESICERLKAKGFASTNVVLGIGSYTYQYNTRDTFGFAMKATYGEVEVDCPTCMSFVSHVEQCPQCKDVGRITEAREIFKDPITDDGTKRSKKGLLRVSSYDRDAQQIYVQDQCTWEQESGGLLQTVFKDGKLVKTTTLEKIREKLIGNVKV